ncbi:MAG: hypothetical protein OEZ32_08355 [Nitrospinota bacterium]|nr:hypothetical protein [Nitrospinota bacterium]
MAHPETCSACHGDGTVNWERLDGSIVELKIKCSRCDGRGWVVEMDAPSQPSLAKSGDSPFGLMFFKRAR